jgi:hypothetical protein
MLNICYDTGVVYDLLFNPAKTVCGVFGLPFGAKLALLSLSGASIDWSEKILY